MLAKGLVQLDKYCRYVQMCVDAVSSRAGGRLTSQIDGGVALAPGRAPSRRPRRAADEERAIILDRAIRLMATQGVAQTTLAEASVRSGFPRLKATRLFASRTAFIGAAARRIVRQFLFIAMRRPGPASRRGALEDVVAVYRSATLRFPHAARALQLICAEALLDPVLRRLVDEIMLEAEQVLDARLHVLDAGSEEGVSAGTSLLLASLLALTGRWLIGGDKAAYMSGCDRLVDRSFDSAGRKRRQNEETLRLDRCGLENPDRMIRKVRSPPTP